MTTTLSIARATLQRWRLPMLCLLLLLSFGSHLLLLFTAPPIDTPAFSFVSLWLFSYLPYLLACFLVVLTRPESKLQRRLELILILAGALLLRALFIPFNPNLSHDSWRYLWDARITLQGYSPYVYAPGDPLLLHLRDFIYDNSRFRGVPSLYPPGAQALYLLSYLIAPSNLYVLKAIFTLFDLVTCAVLALLLYRQGLDPARCIIYAWCPLPIIEFALQGHVDVLVITFILLTILAASSTYRGARIVTGFLLALAIASKLYPLLLLPVVARRRDWALLLTCGLTLLLFYLPYLLLSHGQVLGFFSNYANEYSYNSGPIQHIGWQLGGRFHFSVTLSSALVRLLDIIVVATAALVVWFLRERERMSMAAATLLMLATIFAISSHVFPWYLPTLLPWIALLLAPVWTRKQGLNPQGLLVAVAWYVTLASIGAYFLAYTSDWRLYYLLVYDVAIAAVCIAVLVKLNARPRLAKRDARQ